MANPIVDKNDTKYWYNENGELHRLDGPAIEWVNGDKEWYQNGKLHRLDGPAVEEANGDKSWYINGEMYLPLKTITTIEIDGEQFVQMRWLKEFVK